MQVLLEKVGTLKRKLTARVSAQSVESQARARLQELAKTARIKGFRPGRIPASVIERQFGTKARSEAMAAAIASSWQEAVREENLRPALAPSISVGASEGDQIVYTAHFEVLPELGPVDVTTLSLTKLAACVEELDIDQAVETLHLQGGFERPTSAKTAVDDASTLEREDVREGDLLRARIEIRAKLEHELAAAIARRTKADALQQLVAAHADLEVPLGLVELEMNARFAQAQQEAQRSRAPPPTDATQFAADATARVRAFILVTEIARQNAIAPEQKRISATLAQIASGYEEPSKVIDLYVRDSELMATLRNQVIEDQVIDWVIANAQVTEVRVTFSKVIQSLL